MMKVEWDLSVILIALSLGALLATIPYVMAVGIREDHVGRATLQRLCETRADLRRIASEYTPVGTFWILTGDIARRCSERGAEAP